MTTTQSANDERTYDGWCPDCYARTMHKIDHLRDTTCLRCGRLEVGWRPR